MSLDVMRFLIDDFLDKYKKLESSRSSIDAPLRDLFKKYESLLTVLKDIDIASLQGADPDHLDHLYILNCAVDDCLVESAESLHSMAKRAFKSCRQRKDSETRKKLDEYLQKLRGTISSQCGSSVSATHKPASIPLLNYKVHGFEDQFNEIVKRISPSSDQGGSETNMRGVGIVGIGGSGKTTLASMVFNSREVTEKYQIMIWASLTSTLKSKETTRRATVFREILSGVHNNDSLKTMLQKVKYHQGGGSKMADHVLDKYIEHFKDALERNSGKYLIVLDDVWETDKWFAEDEKEPKCILSRELIRKTGGTVVVTSRLEEMAENIVGRKHLYMILPVSGDACFDIFLDRVTKDGDLKREDERKRKKDVVEKCFGLPLAACTVADIVVEQHREKAARKEMEAAKRKSEEEREAEAEEGDGSKQKAEADAEREVEAAKDELAKAEEDASKPKAEPDASEPKAETDDASKPKIEAEAAAAETKAESPAVEAKEEAKAKAEVKEAAPDSKEEADVSQAEMESVKAKIEADASKAESSAVEEAKEEAKAEVKEAAPDSKKEADVSQAEMESVKAKIEADASKAESAAAVEAKEETKAEVKEAAPYLKQEADASKAEEQAEMESVKAKIEADVPKTKAEVLLPSEMVAGLAPPDGEFGKPELKKDEEDK